MMLVTIASCHKDVTQSMRDHTAFKTNMPPTPIASSLHEPYNDDIALEQEMLEMEIAAYAAQAPPRNRDQELKIRDRMVRVTMSLL
jgi:hypothetical protein